MEGEEGLTARGQKAITSDLSNKRVNRRECKGEKKKRRRGGRKRKGKSGVNGGVKLLDANCKTTGGKF